MKKELILGAVLTCLAGIPAANASQIVIEPTLITGAAPMVAAPVPVYEPVVAAPVVYYPIHHDHHHHYDWHYWEHRDHYRR